MKNSKYNPMNIDLNQYDFDVEMAVSPATDCVCGQPLTQAELEKMTMESTLIPDSPAIYLLRVTGLWHCPVCGEIHKRTVQTHGEKNPIAELYEYILFSHR